MYKSIDLKNCYTIILQKKKQKKKANEVITFVRENRSKIKSDVKLILIDF